MSQIEKRGAAGGCARMFVAAAVLFMLPQQGFAQILGSAYWESQTDGRSSGHHGTQDAAIDAWLAPTNGFWMRNGPCGALGTAEFGSARS